MKTVRLKPGFAPVAVWLFAIVVALGTLSACDHNPSEQQKSQSEAVQRAADRHPYVQKNDLEFENYDRRQKLADDPTAILWCTSFPWGHKPFTVPIVGKLTSGGKRPYPTEQQTSTTGTWFPELPGPDGMYGSSGEYRYGFSPAGIYQDFYNLPTFCSLEPTVWQREETTIVLKIDDGLRAASNAAQAALKAGRPAEAANTILEQALQGKGK